VKFSELTRLLEKNGFRIVKQKGSIRYYAKQGCDNLVQQSASPDTALSGSEWNRSRAEAQSMSFSASLRLCAII